MQRLDATCTAANTHTRYGVQMTIQPSSGRFSAGQVARHGDHPPGYHKWAELSVDADAADRAWILPATEMPPFAVCSRAKGPRAWQTDAPLDKSSGPTSKGGRVLACRGQIRGACERKLPKKKLKEKNVGLTQLFKFSP